MRTASPSAAPTPVTVMMPTLWQLPTSHYSEKARWALEHKSISFRCRSPLPGAHVAVARWLTRNDSDTLPILRLEGRTIAGSSAIVAALEDRFDRLPLYPAGPRERARALEIEAWFDDQVGPAVRTLVFHELAKEPATLAEFASASAPGPLSQLGSAAIPYAKGVLSVRYGASRGSAVEADKARAVVREAIGRIEDQLGDADYLVGSEFGIADLTAAALLYPFVRPTEGPFGPDVGRPGGIDDLRDELQDRRGYQWVQQTYRTHRLQRRLT